MFYNESAGYPILDGKVLVKVSLRKSDQKRPRLDYLWDLLGCYLVNLQVRSYYLPAFPVEPVPMIRLNSPVPVSCYRETMEVDLVRDSLSLAGRLRSALGVLTAAGFMVFASLGISGDVSGSDSRTVTVSPGESRSNTGHGDPEVRIQSDREKQLLASLMPGVSPGASNRHYFRLSDHINVTHTNMVGSHQNMGQEYPHENVFEPHGDHLNHGNSAHVNYTDIPHVNSETDVHVDSPHGNHENAGSVSEHTDTPGGDHTNTHADAIEGHTDMGVGSHIDFAHTDFPHLNYHRDLYDDYSDFQYTESHTAHNDHHSDNPHTNSPHTDMFPE